MTNAELIQKIRAEIERLQKYNHRMADNAINSNMRNFYDGEEDCCKQLLSFLSTLESGEPVPKDLEEAADDYAVNTASYYYEDEDDEVHSNIDELKPAFIAGAKWQKQHDAELIEIAYNDGITIGMTKQKEQMMKEAVEGTYAVTTVGHFAFFPDKPIKDLCVGDKVRVIVCKKED